MEFEPSPGKPRPASDRVDCPAPGAFDAGSHRHRSQSHGGQADIRRLNCGEPLPDRLANHDGVVVFAGPMSANDTLDWVRRDIKWPETPLAEDKPLLGLRLGAQILARALGARVFSYDDKRSEIGYYPIEPTLIGNRLQALVRCSPSRNLENRWAATALPECGVRAWLSPEHHGDPYDNTHPSIIIFLNRS
jgi:GMP synthase-like glutamine amidotransferase